MFKNIIFYFMGILISRNILAMLVVMLSFSQLAAASIDIRLSNNNTFGTSSRGAYNIDVSNTDNGGVTGGIVVLITDATVDHDYKPKLCAPYPTMIAHKAYDLRKPDLFGHFLGLLPEPQEGGKNGHRPSGLQGRCIHI